MKKNRKKGVVIICTLSAFFAIWSCSNDDYLIDGGTSSPYFEGTMWEYLNTEPQYERYFSKLVDVIEYAEMEDLFKKEDVTFFAPTSQTINKSMKYLSDYNYNYYGGEEVTDIRQVKKEVWKDFLSLYIVEGKYELKDLPQLDTLAITAYPGQAYRSYNGRPMNIGVDYASANGVKYAGYRMLIYSYINNWGSSVEDRDMINAKVATCNLQPYNGIVHVIRFIDHDFGFDKRLFMQKALEKGIDPVPPVEDEKSEAVANLSFTSKTE
ncbi:fasciclin domain-containing protein [Bacteroides finegoldii]|uniref:fasciclin domain-containing protein n=1 Tax=Bacteroides finegoldii TaxID=338188 RepID=UPI00189A7479|nr:fasciclin domain-containing protein [Bacteroides finegoldii]